jgi:hypothetical protein
VLLIAYFGVYLFAIQSDSFLSLCKEATKGAGATFDWTLFRQFKSKKSCLTTFKSCDVRLRFSSTWKQQLSNIKLVELNQENNYVRLMFCSTNSYFD